MYLQHAIGFIGQCTSEITRPRFINSNVTCSWRAACYMFIVCMQFLRGCHVGVGVRVCVYVYVFACGPRRSVRGGMPSRGVTDLCGRAV